MTTKRKPAKRASKPAAKSKRKASRAADLDRLLDTVIAEQSDWRLHKTQAENTSDTTFAEIQFASGDRPASEMRLTEIEIPDSGETSDDDREIVMAIFTFLFGVLVGCAMCWLAS